MSMPSSSEDVATIARRRPSFSASSTSVRCSRASEPWCARTRSSSASSFKRAARRSAMRRALTNTIVERCARISSRSFGWIAGQIEERLGPRVGSSTGASIGLPSSAMSSTGTITSISVGLRWPASMIVTGRGRRLAIVLLATEEARDLFERALRRRQPDALRGRDGQLLQALERDREVRAALRRGHRVDLVDDDPPDAPERLARLRRQHQVEGLRRRDEDVGGPLQHLTPLVRRRVAGADADRRLVREREPGAARPRARCRRAGRGGSSRRRRPARGAARCRGRECAPAAAESARSASRSIAKRNAASVLPEPVGARISVWSPRAIDTQPSRWAGVGSSNVASNHARTAGEKTSSVTGTPYPHLRTTGEPPLGCGPCCPGPAVGEPSSGVARARRRGGARRPSPRSRRRPPTRRPPSCPPAPRPAAPATRWSWSDGWWSRAGSRWERWSSSPAGSWSRGSCAATSSWSTGRSPSRVR